LSAYADDRTSTSSQSSATSAAGGSVGTSPESQRGTTGTGMSTGGTTGTSSGQHGMDHSRMDSATAAEMKNITTEKFFEKAAAAGMKEVQAAELALKNAQSDQVKSFARKMITDHTKQNSRLTTMAAQNNVTLQKDLPAKDQAEIEKLRNAKGATFDTAYAQAMEKDHQKAVALFQGCANSGKVASDVKSFCRENLATLQEHLQAANTFDSGTSRAASTDE
jgi:putative membrane protein